VWHGRPAREDNAQDARAASNSARTRDVAYVRYRSGVV
jgi:hypothetical protein